MKTPNFIPGTSGPESAMVEGNAKLGIYRIFE
jgi:hypothetical protein